MDADPSCRRARRHARRGQILAAAIAVASWLASCASPASAAPDHERRTSGKAHATAHWVNPSARPVIVPADIPAATTVQLEVVHSGVVVYRGPRLAVPAGRLRLPWDGRGVIADGAYGLDIRDAASGALLAPRLGVLVDRRAPLLRLTAGSIAIPRSGTSPSIRLRDREPNGLQVRIEVMSARGRFLPLGGWRPWAGAGGPAMVTAVLRHARAVGPMRVILRARDEAGNESSSAPAWLDPSAMSAAPLVVVRHVITKRPWVALTVDDGLEPEAIESMLRTLDRLDARATFCFNGVNAGRWSASLRSHIRASAASGHLGICSHGFSHRTNRATPEVAGARDLARNVVWDRVAGLSAIPVYRPPYGQYGPGLGAAAHALGYRYLLLWDLDTRDWTGRSADAIARQVITGARRGSIILEHARANSAAAFPRIIKGLRRRGLEPVRVDDLLQSGRAVR